MKKIIACLLLLSGCTGIRKYGVGDCFVDGMVFKIDYISENGVVMHLVEEPTYRHHYSFKVLDTLEKVDCND